ncbi:hypothetical protein BDA99DRAFT_496574 [Phascolomyces articulosus]|uniref:Uncharacterized protein n=1 Tax=Phascolomyces articulosus TaxID=60185 RepID=A0AAD5KM98_9FUNG|nr:hypothetical protein BDA99DRAFT_496574 [Phascolomyces articulosus]
MINSTESAFNSKIAVITGGSRGIGFNIAKALVERGVKVVLGDILDKEGNAAAKELNDQYDRQVAIYQHTDVTKYSDLKVLFSMAVEVFGGVDIAIMNAGITGPLAGGVFTPLDDEADMRIQEINLGGVIKGDKVALLHMAKQNRGGVIINTGSMSGLTSLSILGQYTASKHGIVGWTRCLANMKEVCNVRVNAVCPCVCDTDLNNNLDSKESFDFLEATPKTKMEHIVKAMLQCIEDPTLAGDLLLALPDGVHFQPSLALPDTEEMSEFLKKLPHVQEQANNRYKKILAEAIKNAGI